MAINTGRVVTGGLLAGLLLNVGDFLINGVLLTADNDEMVRRFGMDPAAMQSFDFIAPWIVIDFLLGLLVVFTYAAMRPRFGPGAKTALIAAATLFVAIGLVLSGFTSLGMMPIGAFVRGSLASAVNMAIGAVAGAWAYTET